MTFVPNLDLYKEWEDAENVVGTCPYIAVFRRGPKTLVYLADSHGENISFDMVDFCFSNAAPVRPDIAVLERERDWQPLASSFQRQGLAYAAAVAAKRGFPVAYADLSTDEMIAVLQKYSDEKIDKNYLHKVLTAGGPSRKRGPLNLLSVELNLAGRDPFMLDCIAAALNQYDNVFAMFGEGHYRSHRLVLEDMLGAPEYIKNVPNARDDFSGIEIVPIDLLKDKK